MANKIKKSKTPLPETKGKVSEKLFLQKKSSKNKSSSNSKKKLLANSLKKQAKKAQDVKTKLVNGKKKPKVKYLPIEERRTDIPQIPKTPVLNETLSNNIKIETPPSIITSPVTVHDKKDNSKIPSSKKKKTTLVASQTPARLNRSVINVIRTTQRNNINLKHIADNKANILMSINALMVTLLFPIILANRDIIVQMKYYIPLGVLALTCLMTLVLSAFVLRPFSNRGRVMRKMTEFREKSPFFFENYESMEVEEYYDYFCTVSQDEETFFKYVIEDLHYYGKILSLKYTQIKHAYTGFIFGIVITAIAMIIVSILYG